MIPVARDVIPVARDAISVSREGGNLLLSGTVSVYVAFVTTYFNMRLAYLLKM